MQGKRQYRCVCWIINWVLQIHCSPRAPLGANKLASEDWTKRYHRVLQRIYGIWRSYCILGKIFARPFQVKQLLFLDLVLPKAKIICFWFQTTKTDRVWRKCFERYITILSVLVDMVVSRFILNYTLEYAKSLVT